jgi:hypothetical protein
MYCNNNEESAEEVEVSTDKMRETFMLLEWL